MTKFGLRMMMLLLAAPVFGQTPLIFSPNGDGIKDEVTFRLNLQENSEVSSWQLDIRAQAARGSKEGRLIKSFSGSGRPPKSIKWDGKDLDNRLVKDATYLFSLSLVTPAGNQVAIEASPLIVDRVPPDAQCSVDPALFSPNGAKPETSFSLKGDDANGLYGWILSVKDKDGTSVRSFRGKGTPPGAVRWDGKGDFEEDVPDGTYNFELMVEDLAGNRTTTPPQKVTIKRTGLVSTVEVTPLVFSPGTDSPKKEVTIRLVSGDPESVDHWEVKVVNQNGKIIHKFTGTKDPPARIVWNGVLDGKRVIPDGTYQVMLSETDMAGNTATTIPQPMEVDTVPPMLEARFEPAVLSPNGDGVLDQGEFHLKSEDAHPLEDWTLKILNDVGKAVRTYKGIRGSKPPAKLDWKGDGENGETLIDGNYSYVLEATDIALNHSVSRKQTLRIDVTPPVMSVSAEPSLFSPNLGDMAFQVNIQDAGPIESWSLNIEDKNGKVVKSFRSPADNIPPRILWNGKNTDRVQLPDGEYTYVLSAKDVAGNKGATQPKKVTIGATAPAPEIVSDLRAISPNADGYKDSATFTLKAPHFNPLKEWTFRILDKSKVARRTVQGRGDVPGKLQWGGERDDKRLLPDDDYSYELEVIDLAGNHSSTPPKPIRIDTTAPALAIRVSPNIFSPNGDGFKDEAIFTPGYKDASPVGKWKLELRSTAKKVVRTFSGEGNLPLSVTWDGKSDDGGKLPDGPYAFIFTAADDVGNEASTFEQIVKIDNTPPQITLQADPALFSPNISGAGTKFALDYQDASDISQWKMTVQKGDFTARTWSGLGRPPRSFPWDGKTERGVIAPDGKYVAVLSVTDEVGNTGQSPETPVTLDTSKPMVTVTAETDALEEIETPMQVSGDKDRDVVISLASEVLFDTGQATVKVQAYPTLMKATYLIRRYPKRTIRIEGHADNVPIHNEAFKNNLELSQGRAEAIMNFFAEKGSIEAERMTAKGFGDKKPRASNDSVEGRRMNRRVEIILVKEPK